MPFSRAVGDWVRFFMILAFVGFGCDESEVAQRPGGGVATEAGSVVLRLAHSHNDYYQGRPLLDALEHGFGSVEADVHLQAGELRVGHDVEDVRGDFTLRGAYLDPLRARVRRNGGYVLEPGHVFLLWVDCKSEALPTYLALDALLTEYADILTYIEGDRVHPGPVQVIVSGNRAESYMRSQRRRYAMLDGRLTDLGSDSSRELMPYISEGITNVVEYRGKGALPDADRRRLQEVVRAIHADGRCARFWGTPDRPGAYRDLIEAGVDLVHADDLSALRSFLKR